MVNKAKRYDPAFKQMVCKRLTSVGEDRLTVSEAAQEFGVKPSTLYNWLHSMYRIPESAQNVSEPPLPSGITSIRQALGIGLHCEELGLDSPEAELYCHQTKKVALSKRLRPFLSGQTYSLRTNRSSSNFLLAPLGM